MKRSSLMTFSVAAHVAVAVGLGAIQVRKSQTPTPVELIDVKKSPPQKEKPHEEPPKPKLASTQKQARPRAAARSTGAPQPSTPRAGFDGMPDFGIALSGTGDGIGIPVAEPVPEATPVPQVKTLVAPPRPAKVAKTCTETLTKPIPINVPRPEFPTSLRDFTGDGKVRVKLTIDATGRVVSAVVLSGMQDEFNEAALAAARRASFEPGTQCGRPVTAYFTIAMRFSSG